MMGLGLVMFVSTRDRGHRTMNSASRLAAALLAGSISTSAFAQADKSTSTRLTERVKESRGPISNEDLRKILRIGVQVIEDVEDGLNRPDENGIPERSSMLIDDD